MVVLPKTAINTGIFNYNEVTSSENYQEFLNLTRNRGEDSIPFLIYEFGSRDLAVTFQTRITQDLGDIAKQFSFEIYGPCAEDWDKSDSFLAIRNQTPTKQEGDTQ